LIDKVPTQMAKAQYIQPAVVSREICMEGAAFRHKLRFHNIS
jgi:hypothetical protein